MDNCIFCKIINGEIPSYTIYEDAHSYAFLDIFPVNTGHVLVIPKTHSKDFLDMEDDDLKNVIIATKKVAKAVMNATHADGFNVGMNNAPAAGQVVFHAHFHIMPRFRDDGYSLWKGKQHTKEEMEAVHASILRELKK